MTKEKPKYYCDVSIIDNEFNSQIEYKYRISSGEIKLLNQNLSDREMNIANYYRTQIEFSMDKDSEYNYFQRLLPNLRQKKFKIIDYETRLEGGIVLNGTFY
jgi:hypothetical protein